MATNTQGKGGPINTSKGPVGKDMGNRFFVSIEPSNNGVGEVWPDDQIDAYITLCAALMLYGGLKPGDIVAHFEWAPGRKADPAGPCMFAPKGGLWNMDAFRGQVWLRSLHLINTGRAWGSAKPLPPAALPKPTSPTKTYRVVKGDTLYGIARNTKTPFETLLRLNKLSTNSLIHPGDSLFVNASYTAPTPTPPVTIDKGSVFMTNVGSLHFSDVVAGSRGRDVKRAQALYNTIISSPPTTPLVEDGHFGPVSQRAFSDFNGFFGLPRIGKVDRETWKILLDLP
jgi:hypothetical protein